MTALAFQNPELLRALADPALTFEGPKALADHLGRDKSNTARTVKALREDGLIEAGAYALTDLGRRVLTGIDMAEGLPTLATLTAGLTEAERRTLDPRPAVWPLDRIVRNPANRKVDPNSIPAMADSLVGQGQLQPITLTPVRDDGMRMLLIGERRWLGALMAESEDRLPDSLAAGLRFEEREATPAEALAITVVENVERQSIPPLELAFLLRDYADAAGDDGKPLDAKSVADRLGLGLRDVQDKIRIARNATPEALAAYAQDGSWDRLRDSIPSSRAKPEAGAALAAGDDPYAEGSEWWRGNDQRIRKGCDGLKPRHLLALVEIADKCLREPAEGYHDHASLCGEIGDDKGVAQQLLNEAGIGFLSGGGKPRTVNVSDWTWGWLRDQGWVLQDMAFVEETRLHRLRETAIGAAQAGALSQSGRYATPWLNLSGAKAEAADDPLVVNGVRYPNATRAQEARYAAGIDKRQANHGGGLLCRPDPTLTQGEIDDAFAATNALADRVGKAAPDAPRGDLAGFLTDDANKLTRLALIEIAHKIGDQRRPLDPVNPAVWTGDVDEDFLQHGCTCGAFWLDAPVSALIQQGAARTVQLTGGHPPMLALTAEGLAFLLNYGCTLPMTGAALVTDQKIAGVSVPQAVGRIAYATPCIEVEASAPAEPDPAGEADPSDPVDLWDRTPQAIAADEALLARVRAFAEAEGALPPTTFSILWRAAGFDPEVVITQGGAGLLANPVDGGEPIEIMTADAGGGMPDQRASAMAWLVGWAVEQALKAGADR